MSISEYLFSDTDLVKDNVSWKNPEDTWHSKFDTALLCAWNQAMDDGWFRYNLGQIETRLVPGDFNFLLQLNPQRAQERRAPEAIDHVNMPFNPAKFNFTKIQPKEVLFHMRRRRQQPVNGTVADNEGNQVKDSLPLLINVSPLSMGHVLMVPDVEQCLPQKLTSNAIQIGLELVLLSQHPGMTVGFNSLCGLASVNHLHIHAWYCSHPFYIQTEEAHELCPGLYEVNKLVPGFVLQLHKNDIPTLTRQVYAITQLLQECEIAHNVLICRGDMLQCSSAGTTVRVIIWPRQPLTGAKRVHTDFSVAVAELGGQIPYYVPDTFHSITEGEIVSRIRNEQLTEKEYVALRDRVIDVHSAL